ncbi:D-alanine aminotransferase [Planctomycetes bacterium CA13]|uniref:D-alanine aminotransferase n=1 Tax=Novipirellula herctigrandis TaxID=2527986 RepID=A0A5C5YYL3_9BACT|nr:D-alanine aminotransferase [Planctomycetes bacterium CA13]
MAKPKTKRQPANAPSRLADSTAYFCGQWIKRAEIGLSVDDIGFLQGVTAVERMRTYSRNVFELPLHLKRFCHTACHLGIDSLPDEARFTELVSELLTRNAVMVQEQGDVGITLFATPGRAGSPSPTISLHLNSLDFELIDRRMREGQPLIITDVTQQPDQTWPRSLKVRSRLHYYLADQFASRFATDAAGVLVDQDGTITETSLANLAIVEAGEIISPLAEQVLAGVTQQVIEMIAIKQSIPWRKERIDVERFHSAHEVLCMGTTTGIWFASQINDGEARTPGRVYERLRDRFANDSPDV